MSRLSLEDSGKALFRSQMRVLPGQKQGALGISRLSLEDSGKALFRSTNDGSGAGYWLGTGGLR